MTATAQILAGPAPTDQDTAFYQALEDAVMQTPRGRWFLSEFSRRNRIEESQSVLSAIEKLTATINETRASASLEIMRRELQEMSASIVQTRREIASIKPTESGHNKIVSATEELDHIVRSTEQATADILTASERLQAIGMALQDTGADQKLCAEIDELATTIMLSCSFQDLTGQRTSKVVHALRYIEQRVNSMIQIWGVTETDAKGGVADTADKRRDAHLLNGPAKDGEGVSQDDIDKLLSGEIEASSVAPAPVKSAPVAVFAAKGEAKPTPVPEPAEMDNGGGGPASQADIDALFD
jgi:chemotaxis regulatin CheY-phosphate phosphatase CheZ